MLRQLAEEVLSQQVTVEDLDLRIADVFNAAFAGLVSVEGEILLRRLVADDPLSNASLTAASARLTETDDIHLPSCITPGSVVIPVALALSQGRGSEVESRFEMAVAAGYAAGLRLGMAIGGARALDTGTWPTLLAAPLMAATTAAVLRGHDADGVANAMALALASRSGRLGRPTGNHTARWLVFARAVASGLTAEADAASGIKADPEIVSRDWLAAHSAPDLINTDALVSGHGPSIADTGYKPFATARQGATAIAAFRDLLERERLDPSTIDHVRVEVPTGSHKLVSRPFNPADRLTTLSSIAYQLAIAAFDPGRLYDVARLETPDPRCLDFAKKVETCTAPDLDANWPRLWGGRVHVSVGDRVLCAAVDRLDSDAGSLEVETSIRRKFAHMAKFRPASVTLEAGSCATLAGRNAIWHLLTAFCRTRREEFACDAYH